MLLFEIRYKSKCVVTTIMRYESRKLKIDLFLMILVLKLSGKQIFQHSFTSYLYFIYVILVGLINYKYKTCVKIFVFI